MKIRLPQKLKDMLRLLRQENDTRTPAFLGKSDGTIAGDKANFVWITDVNGDEMQAFNDLLPTQKWGYGIPIWLERLENSTLWCVTGIRQIYPNDPVARGVMEHAPTHSAYSNDPVWVWGDQFMPWLCTPAGLTLKIYRCGYWQTDTNGWVEATIEILNLATHKPTSGARYALVEVDTDGALLVTDGTPVASLDVLALTDIPDPTAGRLALCAVRMYAGQTKITKNSTGKDVVDLRFSQANFSAGGGGTPGGNDTEVQFNDGGVLAGDPNFKWEKGNKRLSVEGLYFTKNGWISAAAGVPGFYVNDNYMALYFDDGGAQIVLGNGVTPEGYGISSVIGGYLAWLDTIRLTSADRTYTLQDASGVLSLGDNQDTKEPTGWLNGGAIAVDYDSAARTITLTGTLEYYWRGVKHALTSPWVSDPHDNTAGVWYLSSSDGVTFVWADTPWAFDAVMVAFVNYGAANQWGICETHGLMQNESHRELHYTIGTYRSSGGVLGSYVLASTTAGDRRPTVTATYLEDEDNQTINAALTSDLYTQAYNAAGATAITAYTVDAAEIVPVLAANPYYNQYTSGLWKQTLMANNSYMSVWLVALPVTDDAASQKYRYLWLQGQTNTNLAGQTALTPAALNLGTLAAEASEFVFLAQIIIRFTGGNWDITSVTNLLGNRFSQVGSPAGNFLSSVATDASLAGDGSLATPLAHSTATGYVHIPTAGAATQILQWTSNGTAKWVTLSGNISIADGGALTIGANQVTLAMLATQAANTILANATAGAAVPTAMALAANTFLARASTGNIAAKTLSDFALTILDDTTAAAVLSTIGAQPVDADLTAIAALAPADDDILQRKSGAWTNRTLVQLVTDLLGIPAFRKRLTANTTYYVSNAGNDTTGTGASGTPWKTLTKALSEIASYDCVTYDVTIQIVDYASNYNWGTITLPNIVGSGSVTIQGNANLTGVVIDGGFYKATPGTPYTIKDLKLLKSASATTYAIDAEAGSKIFINNINLSTGFTIHFLCGGYANILKAGNYTVSGNASYHWYAAGGLINMGGITVTISGALAFSEWAHADGIGYIYCPSTTFASGSATGTRYSVAMNSVIFTNSGGASYLPGNSVSGSVATGGQYI